MFRNYLTVKDVSLYFAKINHLCLISYVRATKPVIESKHQLQPGPADLQLLVGRCRLGDSIPGMFMSDWSFLMTPQKATLAACVHFRYSYPIDVSHLSFNFLCLLLLLVGTGTRYLSRWVRTMHVSV